MAEVHGDKVHQTSKLRLALSWALVGLPLLWGVSQTVIKAMALFR